MSIHTYVVVELFLRLRRHDRRHEAAGTRLLLLVITLKQNLLNNRLPVSLFRPLHLHALVPAVVHAADLPEALEPLNLQVGGDAHQIVDQVGGDADATLVDVVEQRLHLLVVDAAHNDDGMVARVLLEDALEEGAAGGEDELVGAQVAVAARQRHVDQLVFPVEGLEEGADVGEVVVPDQLEHVRRTGAHLRDRVGRKQTDRWNGLSRSLVS